MPIDNHSVLTVHSFLESPFTQAETINTTDDDVFQCGKCKKQFTSITMFITHKKECSSVIALNSSVQNRHHLSTSEGTVIVQKIQMPSSSLSGYTQNVVFADADMLSLASSDVEAITSIPSNTSIQISSDDTFVSQSGGGVTIQQVIPQISTLSSLPSICQSSNAVEVPILNNKLISGPLLLMSQTAGSSGISGYVLNLGNPTVASVEPSSCELLEEKSCSKLDAIEPDQVNELPDSTTAAENNPSTVNVIAEFHSSMVKSRKKNSENESAEANKKDQKLNCAYCSKSFSKNFDLQQHIRCHTGEKPFQCIVCGRAFAQKSNVKKHMHTHKVWPNGLSHTLPSLQKTDFSESSNEKDKGENEKAFSVGTDDTTAGSSFPVSESSYACSYCKYVGKTYYKLKSHMKQHEMEKVYKCIVSTCGRMFNDLDPFLEHTKSHENEMTYQCHECSKNFPSLYDLGSHQYTHSLYPNQRIRTSKRFFRCSLCLNKYSTPAALNHHIATSPHVYSCHYCDKVFPCERYLRRHLHIHIGLDSFICKYCDKGFKTEHYLKVHMLIHSDSKPFKCNLCTAAFNRKDKLKRHLLIHEPVKKLKCPFRSHSGCIKEFNRPDKLKAHILTHSYIKPYTCRACGKSFTRFTHLRNHIKLHNNGETLSTNCQFCGEKLNEAEEHWCSALKQQRMISRKLRLARSRNPKKALGGSVVYNSRRKYQRRRQVKIFPNSKRICGQILDASDDIPTAHIEIISTDGEFVGNSTIAHIMLSQNSDIDNIPNQFQQTAVNDTTSHVVPLVTLPVNISDVECTEIYKSQ